MTAINLPGQTELPIVVDHSVKISDNFNPGARDIERRDISLAKLLRDYDSRPSSETWSKIQKLSAEILK